MSNNIKLSPKYGVNPTIPVCFWCGESKNEIALLGKLGDGRKGEDFEAPMSMVLNYEPCDKCREAMESGFTIMVATSQPNSVGQPPIQGNLYPTGQFAVVTQEAAERIFPPEYTKKGKLFVDPEVFQQIMS